MRRAFPVRLGLTSVIVLLLGLSSRGHSGQSSLQGVAVFLRCRGERAAYIPHETSPSLGVAVAKKFFAKHFPGQNAREQPLYEMRWAWRVVRVLQQPAFRKQLSDLLALGGREKLFLFLVLDDRPDRIYAGERIVIPANESIGHGKVRPFRATETLRLSELSKRHSVPVEEIVALNPERFDVVPHYLKGRIESIWAGERGLARLCRGGEEDIETMLLHELAHLIDGSKGSPLNYGPDGRHFIREILTPATAFHEGFAHACSFMSSSKLRQWRQVVPDRLKIEKTDEPGRFLQVSKGALGVADYFSNATSVGNILADIRELSPASRDYFAALEASWKIFDPTLCDFLHAYVKLHPSRRSQVETILRHRTRDCESDRGYGAILEGTLPGSKGRNVLPR